MAHLRMSPDAASAAAVAITSRCDGGALRIYAGPRPPQVSTRGELLAELRFSNPAFQPAKDGESASFPIQPGVAVSQGEAQWFCAVDRQGRAVFDGKIGKKPWNQTEKPDPEAAMLLPATFIQPGVVVTLPEPFVFRQAHAG